ncbi:MAG: hypothetical protein JZU50_15765 [Desulfobulbaceae bacterium]|nr:hypothetical protein [Desulfobulbaceae bacterium]
MTTTGCTLRLFKSPRCIHCLRLQVEKAMTMAHGGHAVAFLSAMLDIGNRTMLTLKDFTSPKVISTAVALYAREVLVSEQ